MGMERMDRWQRRCYATSKNIPDAAILKPEDYNFKFEVNTIKPYNGNRIKLMIGQVNGLIQLGY